MGVVRAAFTTCEAASTDQSDGTGHSFLAYLDRIKPKVDERIQHLFENGSEGSVDRRLEAPLRHGKRLRAGLLMLIFETYGQEKGREMALDLASAVEIAHTSSLIVDDMLDEDDSRHGLPTLHLTAGHKSAMLGTIGLLSYPYQITSRFGEECVLGMARTHRAMVQAATREMKGVPRFRIAETYEGIIENKTGLLFGLAARYGAYAAGCTANTIELCSEFGTLTGKVMQIADDMTDLDALLNGRKTGISGSEAILLRCCLGQVSEGPGGLDSDLDETIKPLDVAHRKDVQNILVRRLEEAIANAAGAVQRLKQGQVAEGMKGCCHLDLPELRKVPSDIATMVLNERK